MGILRFPGGGGGERGKGGGAKMGMELAKVSSCQLGERKALEWKGAGETDPVEVELDLTGVRRARE